MLELQKPFKNKYIIRIAINSDFRKIIKIEKELNLPSTSFALFKSLIKEHNVFILKNYFSKEIIGFIQFRGDSIESEIITLGVKQKFQNIGLGKKLFDYMVKKGYGNIFLEVCNSNKQALKFYEKIGFKKISIRKNYYINNKNKKKDAFLMCFKKSSETLTKK